MNLHRSCPRYLPLAVAALLATTSVPTLAQADPPMPPDPVNIDQNGMSVSARRPVITPGSMSIGPQEGGFKFSPDMFQLIDGDSFAYIGDLGGELKMYMPVPNAFQKRTIIQTSLDGGSDVLIGPLNASIFPGGTSLYGTGATMAGSTTGPIYVQRDGTKYHFIQIPATSSWAVSKIEKPDGEVRNYTWEFLPRQAGGTYSWPRITSITNNFGYQVKITYQPGALYSNHISTIILINNAYEYCAPNAACSLSQTWPTLTATYTTGTSPSIQSMTLPSGRIVTMGYPGNGYSVATPGATASNIMYTREVVVDPCSVQQSADVRINNVTVDGHSWLYVRQVNSGGFGPTINGTTTVTDPQSGTSVYTYNFGCKIAVDGSIAVYNPASPQIVTQAVDALGRTTKYDYDSLYRMQKVTLPDLSYWQYAYDDRGNQTSLTHYAVPSSGLPAQVTETNTFPSSCSDILTCNRPTSVADTKGNVTDYTYSPDHGGVLTKTDPAVGGIRPQTRYEYVQRYAWIKDASGSYVHAASPVWLLSATRTCRATATVGNACAGGASDEVVTAYDYGPDSGPNNLLLRGMTVAADGQTQRTCYGVDRFGNRISETKPAVGLTSCY